MSYIIEDYFNITQIHKDVLCVIQCMKNNHIPQYWVKIIRYNTRNIPIRNQAQNSTEASPGISIYLNNIDLTNDDAQTLMDALDQHPEFASQIVCLDLSSNNISFIKISDKLTALQRLMLCSNKLTSCSFIIPSSLTKLKSLHLESNQISAFLTPLFLPRLCALHIEDNPLTTNSKIMLNYLQFIKGTYIDQAIAPNQQIFKFILDIKPSHHTPETLTIEHFKEHCKIIIDEITLPVTKAIIDIQNSDEITLNKLIDYLRVILMSEHLLKNYLNAFHITFKELFKADNQQLVKHATYTEDPDYLSNINTILTIPNRLEMVHKAMSTIQDQLLEEKGLDCLKKIQTYLQKDTDFAFLLAQKLLHNIAIETKLSADYHLWITNIPWHHETLVHHLIKWVFSFKNANINFNLEPDLHHLIYGCQFFRPPYSFLSITVNNICCTSNGTDPVAHNYRSKPKDLYFRAQLPNQIRHELNPQKKIGLKLGAPFL